MMRTLQHDHEPAGPDDWRSLWSPSAAPRPSWLGSVGSALRRLVQTVRTSEADGLDGVIF
jgi:hypothetical protein